MAITDYIPNIFGAAAPSSYENLQTLGLITPQQVEQQRNTANIQGLLGAGLALAQGMSRIGPRRSAAENILGALAGGYGAAGGAYQQGIQNVVQQQQLQSAALQQQQALNKIESLKAAKLANPDIAYLADLDPGKFAEEVALRQRIKGISGTQQGPETPESLRAQAYSLSMLGPNFKTAVDQLNEKADRLEVQGQAPVVNQPAVITPQVVPQEGQQVVMPTAQAVTTEQGTAEKTLPAVSVTETKPTSRFASLNARADAIRKEMDRLSDPRLAANKSAKEAFDRQSKQLEEVRKQIQEAAVAETDLKEFRASAPEQFKPQIDNLNQLSITGQITPDQLSQRMTDISKQINDYKKAELEYERAQKNYQNEVYRIGQKVAPGVDPKDYTPQQIAEIQKQLVKQEKELRIAGRTLVTQNMYGDKELLKHRIKGAVDAEESAMGAINVANDVRAIVDVLKPYQGGKIDEFKAAIGSYLPDTSIAQLSTANDLAVAIRARVAPTLRVPGSGATSDFETKQFLAAIPSLMQYANGRELIAVYTEKLANRAAAAADLRTQMIENGNYSVKNFQQAMKDQGLDRVFTNSELATLRSGKTTTEPGSTLPQSVKDKYNLK
jgi:hypothetical protein